MAILDVFKGKGEEEMKFGSGTTYYARSPEQLVERAKILGKRESVVFNVGDVSLEVAYKNCIESLMKHGQDYDVIKDENVFNISVRKRRAA